jgi:CDP-diglyceride synthetase
LSNDYPAQIAELSSKLKATEAELETARRSTKGGTDWSELAQFLIAISMIITFSLIVYLLITPLSAGTATDFTNYKEIINLLATIYGAWIASIIGFYFGRKSGQTIQASMQAQLDYTKTVQGLLSSTANINTLGHQISTASTSASETKSELESIKTQEEELRKLLAP